MSQEFRRYEHPRLDGRVKLLPSQYPRVRVLYKKIGSLSKVAALFGVTKNTILFIVNPEYKERDRLRKIEDKVWLKYYNRQKHTKAIHKYRDKKRELGHVIIKGRDKINKPKLCVCCHKNPVE
jgi:hypothetical protein